MAKAKILAFFHELFDLLEYLTELGAPPESLARLRSRIPETFEDEEAA